LDEKLKTIKRQNEKQYSPPKKLNFWGERILNKKIIYDTKITTRTNNKMWLQHASLLQNVGAVH
jgi:hypothetical protein